MQVTITEVDKVVVASIVANTSASFAADLENKPGAITFIAEKDFDIAIVPPPPDRHEIPEPTTTDLILLALVGVGTVSRRQYC